MMNSSCLPQRPRLVPRRSRHGGWTTGAWAGLPGRSDSLNISEGARFEKMNFFFFQTRKNEQTGIPSSCQCSSRAICGSLPVTVRVRGTSQSLTGRPCSGDVRRSPSPTSKVLLFVPRPLGIISRRPSGAAQEARYPGSGHAPTEPGLRYSSRCHGHESLGTGPRPRLDESRRAPASRRAGPYMHTDRT